MSEDIYGDAYEAFIDEIYKNGGGEPSAVRAAVDCATKSLRAELAAEREKTNKAEAVAETYQQEGFKLCRERDAEREAHKDTKETAIAFLAVWAVQYQRDYSLDGLHPEHYDMLEKLGARMDSFKRAHIDAPLKGDGDE